MEARNPGFMTDLGANEDDKSMYSKDAILVVCAKLYWNVEHVKESKLV